MNEKIIEHQLGNIIEDFNIFCNYLCNNNEVMLTKSCELLSKKDLFNINLFMRVPKPVLEPIYQQKAYPLLDLLFNLALKGKLFIKQLNLKGRFTLKSTKKLSDYSNLNKYEQYTCLLEIYWTNIDFDYFDTFYRNSPHVKNLAYLFEEISSKKLLLLMIRKNVK